MSVSAISSPLLIGNGTWRFRCVRFRWPMANPNSTLAFESRFGPQSNLIDVAAFLRSARNQTPLQAGEVDHEITQECRCAVSRPLTNNITKDQHSVDDLKASLEDVLNNPRLAAHVLKNHELTVNAIHESADASGKRKRRRMNLPEPALEHPEVTALQQKLDAVKLKSWPYLLDSAAFLRGPRFTDLNPFTEPVCKQTYQNHNPLTLSFPSEAVTILECGHCVLKRGGCVNRDSILSAAVPVYSCSSELATRCAVFPKPRGIGELHTVCIKRDARGDSRGWRVGWVRSEHHPQESWCCLAHRRRASRR